jgi:hypothetical protein
MEESMHTTRSPYSLSLALVSLGTIVVFILTGCQPSPNLTPTNSPEPVVTPLQSHCGSINISNDIGQTVLTLPDGSQIYMTENTEIDFTPVGYCPGLEEHHILLKKGQVAINSLLPAGKRIVISNPNGYVAQVDKTGLVTFDPVSFQFSLACTDGSCNLGTTPNKLHVVNCAESAYLDSNGSFFGPFNIDPDTLVPFGDWLQPQCVPAMTSTPKPPTVTTASTATVNMGATATAYCSSFKQQFPLTPCPTLKP